MSIATELQRIQGAKADIKSAIEAKGVTVPSNALIDSYSGYVDQVYGLLESVLKNTISRTIRSITIPYGTTNIGDNIFRSCGLLENVIIPNTVTRIGKHAFGGCQSIININIPNGVTTIDEYAFNQCSGLTSLTIPDSVTTIGGAAFYNCTSLTSITIEATTPPTLSNANAFTNTNDCPIYVPAASVSAYQSANNWSSLSIRIQAIPTA